MGSDWAWSFAAAIWNWARTDSVDRLSAACAFAPGGHEKAASAVLLACALQRLHSHGEDTEPHTGHGEAMAVLDEVVERSGLHAADLGWILVQRARANSDAGHNDEAESDARLGLEELVDGSDVTATALAAAATATVWGIVAARNFEDADIGNLMTASDNAVSWWRSQTISRALTSAAGKQFDSWAEKRFLFQIGDDAGSADFFAAELNADLLGDHGIWQHISSLKARQRMMSAAASDNEVNELVEGLDALRGSGDEGSLESAVSLRRRGHGSDMAARDLGTHRRRGAQGGVSREEREVQPRVATCAVTGADEPPRLDDVGQPVLFCGREHVPAGTTQTCRRRTSKRWRGQRRPQRAPGAGSRSRAPRSLRHWRAATTLRATCADYSTPSSAVPSASVRPRSEPVTGPEEPSRRPHAFAGVSCACRRAV